MEPLALVSLFGVFVTLVAVALGLLARAGRKAEEQERRSRAPHSSSAPQRR